MWFLHIPCMTCIGAFDCAAARASLISKPIRVQWSNVPDQVIRHGRYWTNIWTLSTVNLHQSEIALLIRTRHGIRALLMFQQFWSMGCSDCYHAYFTFDETMLCFPSFPYSCFECDGQVSNHVTSDSKEALAVGTT